MKCGITVARYSANDCDNWNEFVRSSANGTFLHDRRFMDYHADRFEDHSLVIESDGRAVALLPANHADGTLVSHGGLTYGGLLVLPSTPAATVVDMIDPLHSYLRETGFGRLHYKPVPHIFHTQPSEADLYALANRGMRLMRTDLGSAIPLRRKLPFSSGRKHGAKKAVKAGLTVRDSTEFDAFWAVLSETLDQRHDARPTHSLAEINMLKSRFPDQIRLFAAYDGDDLLAGVVMFDFGRTVHAQYMASSGTGRDTGALDMIVQALVTEVYAQRDWFSFGISSQDGGRELNVGLSRQKEMFGARSVVFQQFEWEMG